MDEFKKRLSPAKAVRREFMDDAGREAYLYCFNGRETEWDNRLRRKDEEPEEIFTDAVATVAEEFYGELFSTMMPENAPWVEYEPGNPVEQDQKQAAEQDLEQFETAIARAIRASNFYDEGPTAFQDAVVGTVAMWADRPALSLPINFEAVPISEVYLRLGPRGIEDRFRCKKYDYADLPVLFPRASFDRETADKIKNSKGSASVQWGFWRDYSDPSNPIWLQRIRVDGKSIGLDIALGEEGSCPLVVGRFNPVPGSPWGRGPAVRMLPTLRVLDEVTRMTLEGMDRNLDPPYFYTHDGMTNISDGLEAGLGYPVMPGSTIEPIKGGGDLDYGFFSQAELREIVRDGFYREIIQKGKTPPSASQYLGEEQKQVRRMARPAAKLWREIGVGVLKRVEFLERGAGGSLQGDGLPPLLASGAVIARPISPLERAQAREEVLVAQSIMGIAQESLGPEQTGLLIDGPKTVRNIKEKLKDKMVEVRTEKAIMELMMAMQQMNAGAPGEAQG